MFEQVLAKLEESPAATHPPTVSSVAVIGADAVGQALACAALSAGCDVALHSTFGRESQRLTDADDIEVEGGRFAGNYSVVAGKDGNTRGRAIRVVAELDLAVKDVDVIVLAVPATVHATYASLLAPVLRAGQLVVLAPGRSFGALEFARVLRSHRSHNDVVVVELSEAPFLVTQPQAGRLVVHDEYRVVLAAALTNTATQSASEALQRILPMVRPASGVLQTTFSNMAGLLVAAPALLGASTQGAATLRERLTPDLVDSILVRLDHERRRTASALGVRDLPTFAEWLETSFGTVERDTVNALDEVLAFSAMMCPTPGDAAVRDAVATSLVPIESVGKLTGVPTPTTSALVSLASALHGFDHERHGRSMGALGLDRLRPDEIRRALDGADTTLAQEVLA